MLIGGVGRVAIGEATGKSGSQQVLARFGGTAYPSPHPFAVPSDMSAPYPRASTSPDGKVHGFLVQNIGIANAPDARNALTALTREFA